MFSIFSKDYCPYTSYNPVVTAILQIALLLFIDFWICSPATQKPLNPKTPPSILPASGRL